MFKFILLHNHLYFAPKTRKTSQYLIKTDFPKGNHVLQLFGRNLGCYLHYFQYQMRCYGCTKYQHSTVRRAEWVQAEWVQAEWVQVGIDIYIYPSS